MNRRRRKVKPNYKCKVCGYEIARFDKVWTGFMSSGEPDEPMGSTFAHWEHRPDPVNPDKPLEPIA